MRSRQLECFVCICETGSITRAAAQLNVAQPALGVQLRALEREFGAKLVERTPAGTVPTPAGRLFLDEARNILRRIEDLKHRLREIDEKKPQVVRVGMPASMTGYLASRLFGRAKAELPSLQISMVEGPSNRLIEQLRGGTLDLAVAFEAATDVDLTAQPVLSETLCLVVAAGSRLARQRPIRLKDLRDIDLTMPGEGDVVRKIVTDVMKAHGMLPNIAYPVSSMPAMIDVVVKGLACAVLPAGAVEREVAESALVVRQIVDPSLIRSLSIVQSRGKVSTPDMSRLVEMIDTTLRQIGAEKSRFEIYENPTRKTGGNSSSNDGSEHGNGVPE
jgi:LysR family transcriptional regulator, nitrogen assimilation regulatory protein